METANHECYTSPEVARLLKQAGFDWDWQWYHIGKNAICMQPSNNTGITLDVAQRWLREVKNLILLIDIAPSYCNGKPTGYKFVIHISCGNHIWGEWKDTYEEAQEAGIKKALEIILEKEDK